MLLMEEQQQEEFLTPREIAKRFRVHEATIRWHIREGNLEAIRFGKQYRVSRRALLEFLEKRNPPPTKDEEETPPDKK